MGGEGRCKMYHLGPSKTLLTPSSERAMCKLEIHQQLAYGSKLTRMDDWYTKTSVKTWPSFFGGGVFWKLSWNPRYVFGHFNTISCDFFSSSSPGALYPSAWAQLHARGGRIYGLRTRHAVPGINSEDGHPRSKGPSTRSFQKKSPHHAEKTSTSSLLQLGCFFWA